MLLMLSHLQIFSSSQLLIFSTSQLLNFSTSHLESTPKSPINWILTGVEGCKQLIIRTLRLRSVSGFPLNCLFGADLNPQIYKSPRVYQLTRLPAYQLTNLPACHLTILPAYLLSNLPAYHLTNLPSPHHISRLHKLAHFRYKTQYDFSFFKVFLFPDFIEAQQGHRGAGIPHG